MLSQYQIISKTKEVMKSALVRFAEELSIENPSIEISCLDKKPSKDLLLFRILNGNNFVKQIKLRDVFEPGFDILIGTKMAHTSQYLINTIVAMATEKNIGVDEVFLHIVNKNNSPHVFFFYKEKEVKELSFEEIIK